MISSVSTESLLNAFPMFGHTGWSALEYAGAFEEGRLRNTSATSESLKRISTASTQDENTTPPTTAGTQPTGSGLSSPVQFIDEFGCQQRRKGAFLNHTPRGFEMRTSRPGSARTSQENSSRPGTSHGDTPFKKDRTFTSPFAYSPSACSYISDTHTMHLPKAPFKLDSKHVPSPTSPEVLRSLEKQIRRSSSVPTARILTYEPRSTISSGYISQDDSIGGASSPSSRPQDQKRQRRQTPFKIANPKAARHAPLEPLVAKHRRKASHDTVVELLPQIETDKTGEMGTFGVIQRYFDSQTGGPVSASKTHSPVCSLDPPNNHLPGSEPAILKSNTEPMTISPIDTLVLNEPPPAVPDRSPKRLTIPAFPSYVKSILAIDSDMAVENDVKESPFNEHDYLEDALHVAKKRTSKRIDVGQAGLVGCSQVGRLAPPILSHDALTASADMGLNDLSYYLKHTGPSTETQPTVQEHKKMKKLFKVKQRKSLAARVGSVESSPQGARRQASIPTCAREMTTSGGARHLKIIIPTESPCNTQLISAPASQFRTQRRSRHVSITFDEEMLNPLASPEIEHILAKFEARGRSFSAPVSVSQRSPKKPPQSLKAVPVEDHPLAEPRKIREDQTRARKLRDLQRIKRKPLPSYYGQKEQQVDAVGRALPTPAHTPEPPQSSALELDSGHDEGIEEEREVNELVELQKKVVLLQRQTKELTEALAYIVGLEMDGNTEPEQVLKAFREVQFSPFPVFQLSTMAATDGPLFSTDLISPEVLKALPEGYGCRPLERKDYANGFLDVLRVLTTVGDITEEQWNKRYDWMSARNDEYFLLCITDSSNAIVGTGALIVERKFIHQLGLVGHIEDIAVAKDQQGKKLGLRIIQALDFVAEKVGCYKTILDCSEANEGFYVKCGFKRAGLEMAHYYGR
ncbi:glucosamine 6-phosphate N-acetyltransferase [Pyrenophora seminiperda CCB06]|uniref:Glucosamine 6-phosphate N-acetyltransferase n=1 Tax=Pyrenophora seminiperda CCB06 TaxID=1302712 RepID=A0A3M7MIR2_9PLEO|nr:glucosamine 6-phosphate N-acetyltransferase [Pyrenophora seminiperda CCB06]